MAVNTWDGAVSTDWNDAGNWNTTGITDRVPTSADDVIIPNTSSINNPTLSATGGNPKNVNSLKIEANGTIVGGGIAIRVYGENSNGYAVDNDGIIDGGSTLHLIIKTDTTTALDLNGTSGSFTNVEIDHASCVAQLAENASILGTLTVTLGEFDTASNRDLTVGGYCDVTGTLTLNGSTVSVAALRCNSGAAVTQDSDGTLALATGSNFGGSEGSTYSLRNVDGTSDINLGGTTTVSGGAYFEPRTATVYASVLNNIVWNNSSYWVGEILIGGTLVVNASKHMQPYGGSKNVTVNGEVTLNGQLTAYPNGHSDLNTMTFKSLTIGSGGAYAATTGTTTITSKTASAARALDFAGTFTHNNGTVKLALPSTDWSNVYPNSAHFYNFIIDTGSIEGYYINDPLIVLNNLDVQDGTIYANSASSNDGDITVYGLTTVGTGADAAKLENVARTVTLHGGITVGANGTFETGTGTNNVGGIRNLGGTIS